MGILDSILGAPGSQQLHAMGILGQALATGQGAGAFGYANQLFSPENQMKMRMAQLELENAEGSAEDRKRKRDFLANLPDPTFAAGQQALAGGGGPTLTNAAAIRSVNPYTQQLFEATRAGVVPYADYLKASAPKGLEFSKVDPKDYTPESLREASATGDYTKLVPVRKLDVVNGQAVNLYNAQPGTVFDNVDPNKPFNLRGGQAVPNTAFQSYELNKARAGASSNNVTVNTEKSYGGEFGKLVAQQDAAAIDAARSAPQRVQNAQQVLKILDTQAPITGTGADARLAVQKAFATAGLIDGQSVKSTEDLASLLASQTLDAIKSSGLGGGQGFTDKDRQFLERARSGNIEMNAGTLRTLALLNEKAARASITRGKDVAKRLQTNPDLGFVTQGLDGIEDPPAYAGPSVVRKTPAAPGAPSIEDLLKKYGQ